MSDSECRLRKRAMWMQVYSAVMQGLLAHPEDRHSWDDLRDRARIEANAAMRTVYEEGE
jgi:hypothetical protein